ncbi:hypothetical protein [Janthinobacterium sp. LM6]|uniref:hypothetical protein n=1 Tax=Janthinobacterium sp. LM6 TaxID=1938606 RepID=UPI0015C5351B|nr:hypothetical protein [Janthinobacterium sp. LM6]
MEILNELEIENVSGGLDLSRGRLSDNVIDCTSGSCYDSGGYPLDSQHNLQFDP